MKGLIQPNGWSCLPTAFAMILQVEVDEIFNYLDHDGSEILWPNLGDPWGRRSFHIQEMINFALRHGYSVTTITPELGITSQHAEEVKMYTNDMFDHCTKFFNGVLTGEVKDGLPHAIAWWGNKAYDTSSGETFRGEMSFHRFHIIQKCQ